MMRYLMGCLLVWGLLAQPARAEETVVDLSPSGTALIYRGQLTAEANRQLFALYERLPQKPDTLVITSMGGGFEHGLALGEWVFDHGLRVQVPTQCNSSCANYVFTAGRTRELGMRALLIFHGGTMDSGPQQINARIARLPAAQQPAERVRLLRYLQGGQQREAAFFRRIGVAQQITSYGSLPRYQAARKDYPVWTYSLEMLARFGVRDVRIMGDERWFPLADNVGQIMIFSPQHFACIPANRVIDTLVACSGPSAADTANANVDSHSHFR